MRRLIDGERGGKLKHKSGEFIASQQKSDVMPAWLSGPIHVTHRAALKCKDPKHYAGFEEGARLDYYWPKS